jgi:hypothetical protein
LLEEKIINRTKLNFKLYIITVGGKKNSMKTVNKIYRIKRDMSGIIEIIPTKKNDASEEIPVEKAISKILHQIITQKEGDIEMYESEK